MLSFLKKENEPQEGMAKGDIIFIVVLISLGIGIYFYSNYIKKASVDTINKCVSLYDSHEYAKASQCFDEDVRSLHYKTDSLDKVLYEYSTKLYQIESAEREVYNAIKGLNAAKNYDLMNKMFDKFPAKIHYLTVDQQKELDSWKALAQNQSKEMTPSDSTVVDSLSPKK